MLDPFSKLSQVANAFARYFSGGRVCLADLPCGSGAATLTILTVLAELRRQSRIPREPLEVTVIGGEISEHARRYAAEAIDEVRPILEEQAIWVEPCFSVWDVCDSLSTTDLIRKLTLRGHHCGARFLVLANFSHFLQHSGKFNQAKPQLDEIFRHCRDEKSSAIWIEPQTNAVVTSNGLFGRVMKWFAGLTKYIHQIPAGDPSTPIATSEVKVAGAIDASRIFEVRLAVMRFDLQRGTP